MPNRLLKEKSLYLQQHAHNPVDWYPWGEEAFQKAINENKPLLISIGYAACHWCHVMERESFEDKSVAQYMNEHFVCIKIDREEYPGVDHYYMDAVQAITGAGGWPLNVFASGARKPFYGGTYFPPKPLYQRASWMQVLQSVQEYWQHRQQDWQKQTQQLHTHLSKQNALSEAQIISEVQEEDLQAIAQSILKQADTKNGGFGSAPKFPSTMAIRFLIANRNKNSEGLAHALHSLDRLINAGIFDYLGGGMARYATDPAWMVPHFEKMLYDQALLLEALADAYAVTKHEKYKIAIYSITQFCERELGHKSGIYYCALDADSEGEEGKFYAWTYEEWQSLSKGRWPAAEVYFGFEKEGNWEGKNIIHLTASIQQTAQALSLSNDEVKKQIAEAAEALRQARNLRVRPATDDKILLSWNALYNHAISRCAMVLGDAILAQHAVAHLEALWKTFYPEGQFYRACKEGEVHIAATLEDLAYLLYATLQISSQAGEEEYLLKCYKLLEQIDANFTDEQEVFYYFTDKHDEKIPIRKIEWQDAALPSVNAVMAENLQWMGMLFEHTKWTERAYVMLSRMLPNTKQYGLAFAQWALLLFYKKKGLHTALCTDKNDVEKLQQAGNHQCKVWHAHNNYKQVPLLLHKTSAKQILMCTSEYCSPPFTDVTKALQHLNLDR